MLLERRTMIFSHHREQLKKLGIELIQEDYRYRIIMHWVKNLDSRSIRIKSSNDSMMR